jgi:hypothetical protein
LFLLELWFCNSDFIDIVIELYWDTAPIKSQEIYLSNYNFGLESKIINFYNNQFWEDYVGAVSQYNSITMSIKSELQNQSSSKNN